MSLDPKLEWKYIKFTPDGRLYGDLLLYTDIHVDDTSGISFTLTSKGGYSCQQPADSYDSSQGQWVMLLFQDAIRDDRYSLSIEYPDGTTSNVFKNVPWRTFIDPEASGQG